MALTPNTFSIPSVEYPQWSNSPTRGLLTAYLQLTSRSQGAEMRRDARVGAGAGAPSPGAGFVAILGEN